jgi:hypothetical protein
MKVYQKIAGTLQAYCNCVNGGNAEWKEKHLDTINLIMRNAPSGSGIDSGTKFYLDANSVFDVRDKLIPHATLKFSMSFHHMDEWGGYDGWTNHVITVHPDLAMGYRLTISGRNRNQIKDYLYEVYSGWLESEVTT